MHSPAQQIAYSATALSFEARQRMAAALKRKFPDRTSEACKERTQAATNSMNKGLNFSEDKDYATKVSHKEETPAQPIGSPTAVHETRGRRS